MSGIVFSEKTIYPTINLYVREVDGGFEAVEEIVVGKFDNKEEAREESLKVLSRLPWLHGSLQWAMQSGKGFKRKGWNTWCRVSTYRTQDGVERIKFTEDGITRKASFPDCASVLAMDWVVEC